MMDVPGPYDDALRVAAARSQEWLNQLPGRSVPPRVGADEIRERALALLDEPPLPATEVIEELAGLASPASWPSTPVGSSAG